MLVPYSPPAIYFNTLTSHAGHIFTHFLNHGAVGGGPLGSIWCSRGEHQVVWHIIAKYCSLCVSDVCKLVSLPSSPSYGGKELASSAWCIAG